MKKMPQTNQQLTMLLIVSLVLLLTTACAKETATNEEAANSSSPVTLSLYASGLNLTDLDFQSLFVDPLKQKYPQITLQLVRNASGSTPQDLINSGTFPDIIFTATPSINQFKELGIPADLKDLVQKYHVDVNQFDSQTIETIQAFGDKGELFALPYSANRSALFYNKDIFDKFGIGYPKEGMTWDEATDLARKINQNIDDVQYQGINIGDINLLGSALSLPVVDPSTHQAVLSSQGWQRVFEAGRKMQEGQTAPVNQGYGRKLFLNDKTLAMFPDWVIGMLGEMGKTANDSTLINWDVVSLPVFPEAPAFGRRVDLHLFMLTRQSKHQQLAFQLIQFLTSHDSELLLAKQGQVPAMSSPDLMKNFGANLDFLKGKNKAALFQTKPAKLPTLTDYDDLAQKQLANAFNEVASGQKDVNSALREAQDAANKSIAAQQQTN